jgi:hypothetical protein
MPRTPTFANLPATQPIFKHDADTSTPLLTTSALYATFSRGRAKYLQQVSYSHPLIGSALHNLIFTNVSDLCQKQSLMTHLTPKLPFSLSDAIASP